MPDITPCIYCGSESMLLHVGDVCEIRCSRCGRRVSAGSLRKAARRWVEDLMKVGGLPWPVLLCPRCGTTPRLENGKDGGGYRFVCGECGSSSRDMPTPYDAMLSWRTDVSIPEDDRCP